LEKVLATQRIGSVLLAGALALSACASDADDDEQAEAPAGAADSSGQAAGSSTTENEEDQPVTTDGPAPAENEGQVVRSYPGTTYPPELSAIIDLAIEDLAGAVPNVDASAVNVVEVAEMTWSDAGLGCPEPGFSYPQVVTDGLRIMLEAGGQTYDYRSGDTGEPRRCQPAPAATAKPSTTISIEDGSTTVTAGSSDDADDAVSTSVVTRGSGGEDEPTEGNNPPDE